MRRHTQTAGRDRARICAGAGALALVALLAYWPAFRAWFEGDDFALLAFARILRNPLALFAHEHFALGPYFRPLSMSLWWLSAQAFGAAPLPHYAVNLVLHVATSIALWRLLAAIAPRSRAPFTVALLFALHPVAIGTSLWLADRFDLMATLFALLALHAAWPFRASFSPAGMAGAALLLAAAVLSKETGIVAVGAVAVLWLWPAGAAHPGSPTRAARCGGAGLLCAGAAAWCAWRFSVLHAAPAGPVDTGAALPVLLVDGGARWFADFLAYTGAWGRLPAGGDIVLVSGLVAAAAGLFLARRGRSDRSTARPDRIPALACAAAIVVACAALEAPFARQWSVPFGPAPDPTSIAAYSRLFYFPLCAIAIAITATMGGVSRAAAARPAAARLLAASAVLLGLPWLFAAHDLAQAFQRRSVEKRLLVTAAVDAVLASNPPGAGCRIFLLGIGSDGTDYVLRTMTDAVVKAVTPDLHRIQHCLLQSEQASWADVIGGAPLHAAEALPLRPMSTATGVAPWIEVGGVQVAYLNLDGDIDARALSGAIFLQREGLRFVDAGAAVRSGALPVHFACARPAEQCRH